MSERRELQFGDIEIRFVENTAELPRFDEVVQELARGFVTVRVSRSWAGPASTPLFGDIAIVLLFNPVTAAFLYELGKDAYGGLRAQFFALYHSAKTWANGRGYVPFAIRQHCEDSPIGLQFNFPEGLAHEEFEDAVLSITDVLADLKGKDLRGLGFVYRNGHWEATKD